MKIKNKSRRNFIQKSAALSLLGLSRREANASERSDGEQALRPLIRPV